MWLMLQKEKADDYVLATGRAQSVREFVVNAGEVPGMDIVWNGSGLNEKGIDRKTGNAVIVVNPKLYRPAEVECLLGDPAKAKERLGWQSTVTIDQLAHMMVQADYDRVSRNSILF
jgi:GDPmannose 4,6-dehydratase